MSSSLFLYPTVPSSLMLRRSVEKTKCPRSTHLNLPTELQKKFPVTHGANFPIRAKVIKTFGLTVNPHTDLAHVVCRGLCSVLRQNFRINSEGLGAFLIPKACRTIIWGGVESGLLSPNVFSNESC